MEQNTQINLGKQVLVVGSYRPHDDLIKYGITGTQEDFNRDCYLIGQTLAELGVTLTVVVSNDLNPNQNQERGTAAYPNGKYPFNETADYHILMGFNEYAGNNPGKYKVNFHFPDEMLSDDNEQYREFMALKNIEKTTSGIGEGALRSAALTKAVEQGLADSVICIGGGKATKMTLTTSFLYERPITYVNNYSENSTDDSPLKLAETWKELGKNIQFITAEQFFELKARAA